MSHPFNSLSIPGIKGQLIFTPCPGTQGTSLISALETLQSAGASALISLMPSAELEANAASEIAAQSKALGLSWFHLPVADEQVPLADFEANWQASEATLLGLLNDGQQIAIHCKGGSGRTGLIAARLMIACGVPRPEAVALVQSIRPKAIQHPAHVQWLQQFDAR